jgi:small subunit ribosomal protein S21
VQVLVRDNNVDQALKALKKKMQREGIFREAGVRRRSWCRARWRRRPWWPGCRSARTALNPFANLEV